MAKVRDLAQGTEMPVLICTGFVEGGDPARVANPEDFRKKRYRAEQTSNFGNVHVTVFSLRP